MIIDELTKFLLQGSSIGLAWGVPAFRFDEWGRSLDQGPFSGPFY